MFKAPFKCLSIKLNLNLFLVTTGRLLHLLKFTILARIKSYPFEMFDVGTDGTPDRNGYQ